MLNKLLALLLNASLTGCSASRINTKAEEEKLMEVSREWSRAASTQDIDRIVSYWSDSAFFLSQGQPAIHGKEGIRAMVEQSSKIPGFKISWEPIRASVSKSGDMGYLVERNQMSMNDASGKTITIQGTVVTVWKKDASGNWKNVVDIGVHDLPN